MRFRLTALVAAFVLAGAVVGCGDDGGVDTGAPGGDGPTTEAPPTEPPTTEPDDGTGGDDGELPGERFDAFPVEGAVLAVVGVEADDTLNVRSGPGTDFDVVVELEPLADGIVATGHNRSLDGGGIWAEITAAGATGWANLAFLSHPGQVTDITAELFPDPGDRPGAETMLELGGIVADLRASEEPPSTITVVDGPTVGDLGEITVDVIGFGDDATAGERLHVLADPSDSGEGFVVRSVEATTFCSRGVTDGLCL